MALINDDHFLAILAHELKSPLNAIHNYMQLMVDKKAGDNIDDYKWMIERSAFRVKEMNELIDDLFDIEKTKVNKHYETVDLVELVNNLLVEFQPQLKDAAIEFSLTIAGKPKIFACYSDFKIIMNNLISNGIKYNKPSGRLTIELLASFNSLKIIVKDTGLGIEESLQHAVFAEFKRIKNEQTKNIPGTGLGLFIINNLVDKYNGQISLHSKPNEGSAFTLTFPIQEV